MLGVEHVGTEELGTREQQALQRLTAVELEQRVLRRGASLHELREAAVTHEHERLRVDVERRNRVAEARIVAQRFPVTAEAILELDHEPQSALDVLRVFDPEHRPFVGQRALRERPPLVELTEQVLARHRAVGEEHLVEVHPVGLGQLGERTRLDAR